MKSINTLVRDIQGRLTSGQPFDEDTVQTFAHSLAKKLASRLSEERGPPALRLSNLGKPARQLWYSINRPELAKPLSASTRFKFLFGDVIEELVMFLARAAGHEVTDEQKEVEVNGVKGHIDGLIDGRLVDVKSASTASYNRFKEGLRPEDDSFGYLTQIGAYASALGKPLGSFVAVDKTLGNIVVDTHDLEDVQDYSRLVAERRDILAQPEPPARCFDDEKEGESGNRKLGFVCSYCPFHRACWPGLRSFQYARGRVVHLTHVEREPNVPEITDAA